MRRPTSDAVDARGRRHDRRQGSRTPSGAWEASLSSIPDFVYAFDRKRRFAYANPAMLGLFGLSADQLLGKTFADLNYPPDLADQLNGHIDLVFREGVTVEDEVFFRSPSGHAAYFAYRWGPAQADDGSVELVVGVSRDTSARRAIEEALRQSEARLRAATELVGMGIYAWEPQTGALHWDERLRAMWGLPPEAEVDADVFEAGIHPDDLPGVRRAIAASVDPAGDGRYHIEYRVIGRDDGVTRHIATSGRTSFDQERPADFIGAAIEMTPLRQAEATIQAREAQFRSFAEHSANLLWIGDPRTGEIEYRSPAYEQIWGEPREQAPPSLEDWFQRLHPDDLNRVRRAMRSVENGEVAHVEYRIVRPDGEVRWLRDTSFPIRDSEGEVVRIGGIAEDLTRQDGRQVYIVGSTSGEERRLARLMRGAGLRVRTFSSAAAFLDIAPFLGPGCVLADLRRSRREAASIPLELRARSIPLKVLVIGPDDGDVATAVEVMKCGAADYLQPPLSDAAVLAALGSVTADPRGLRQEDVHTDEAAARLRRLNSREREVLDGLVEGGTNKSIALGLGLSPRTVELYRGQIMAKLNARSLADVLQLALMAGLRPAARPA